MGRLTEHFSLEEMMRSDVATRLGIDNTPSFDTVANLQALCEEILEPLRRDLGPVHISSGYRSPALNVAIGGSKNSQHCRGEAADITVQGRTCEEVYNYIFVHLPYDQLIREFPPDGWVHVSYCIERRGNALVAVRRDGRTVYLAQGLYV